MQNSANFSRAPIWHVCNLRLQKTPALSYPSGFTGDFWQATPLPPFLSASIPDQGMNIGITDHSCQGLCPWL